MKGILVGSGDKIQPSKFMKYVSKNDYIVAVDGGMEYLLENGIQPDILIGDQDSIKDISIDKLREAKIKELRFPSEKDSTDMELAIEHLINLGIKELIIFSGTGSRLDHSLANIFLLEGLEERGVKASIIDNNNTIMALSGEKIVDKIDGDYISIIPISENGARVSLEGFKYPLDNYLIDFGSTIGISNQVIERSGIVRIHQGKVFLFISRD